MSGKAELSTGQLACLPQLNNARAILWQQRKVYLFLARLKTREARTQESFAELEPFPNRNYYGFLFKKLELEKEAGQLRARAGAVDELLRRFALQEGRVGNHGD